ncbi:MAG: peptidoglycan/xylan/chitin deacetylase (PgdA/CDA1 family) [Crocinitomicaceae bacterium]|jgi:peptidoglycan/xylan/chitin deacetylase (PgdA/CDA1 family)
MKSTVLIIFIICSTVVYSQTDNRLPSKQFVVFEGSKADMIKRVSISIDDVPNVRMYNAHENNSSLLSQLDSLKIPVSIFINEGLIYRGDTISNIQLLESWIKKDFVTCGNHTFGHSRYSESSLEEFTQDIENGLLLSDSISRKYNKEISYFRFPYNDLGKDSVQHETMNSYFLQHNCTIAPFTIESSDWMFNYVYSHYLKIGDSARAKEVGQLYISETLKLFDFYDSLSVAQYQRHANQIYLCHDNRINTDYLGQLINELKRRDYSFISMDETLKDPVYNQDNVYYKKWGISWFYRWMKDSHARKKAMRGEPDLNEIYELYNFVQAEN